MTDGDDDDDDDDEVSTRIQHSILSVKLQTREYQTEHQMPMVSAVTTWHRLCRQVPSSSRNVGST